MADGGGTDDDARIARLTETARRIWPDRDVLVKVNDDVVACIVSDETDVWKIPIAMDRHPRALEMLEVALLVRAGDSDYYKRNYQDAEEECTRERERADALARRFEALRALIERRAAGYRSVANDHVAKGEDSGYAEDIATVLEALLWEEALP